MCGIFVGSVCDLCGICVGYVEYVCGMFGICMEYVMGTKSSKCKRNSAVKDKGHMVTTANLKQI